MKKVLLSILACGYLVAEISDGLVTHYEFEDNAKDSSGNVNDGTEYGGIEYVDGIIGKASSFDGVDDYIKVNDLSKFPSNAIILSYWIKRNNLPTISYENYISKELAFQSYLKSDGNFESGFCHWSGYSINSGLNENSNNWILY